MKLIKTKNLKKYGFDIRIEDYNYIHSNVKKDWDAFINAINPKDGEVIFDGAGGYGEVAEKILKKNKKVEIYLLDETKIQLDRLRSKKLLDNKHIILGDIKNTKFPNDFFNTCVIKMGIHEVRKNNQQKVFDEIYRILKTNGKFVTWELALNENDQKIFQDIIKKKDKLSGFSLMIRNRYFPKHVEMLSYFKKAGFKKVKTVYIKKYKPKPSLRLHELVSKERDKILRKKGKITKLDEDGLNIIAKNKANKLIKYIRKRIPDSLKKKLKFKDLDYDVEFEIEKKIYVGYK